LFSHDASEEVQRKESTLCWQTAKGERIEEEDNATNEVELKEAWSSGEKQETRRSSCTSSCQSVQDHKRAANACLQKGNVQGALKSYTAALEIAENLKLENHEKAVLHSNRAVAFIRTGQMEQVCMRDELLCTPFYDDHSAGRTTVQVACAF
jgi:CCR4-NOT transcriptional regulation complex NOT5 subunit